MAVDEGARHRLHRRLDEVLGRDEAETLMDHLRLLGEDDLARRGDVNALRGDLEDLEVRNEREHEMLGRTITLTVEASEQRILATVRGEMNAQTRLLFFGMLGMNVTLVSLVFAAVRFA